MLINPSCDLYLMPIRTVISILCSLQLKPSSRTLPPQESNGQQKSSDTKRLHRTRVPDKPNYPLNLWSIMKNCIGKELSKIPMPVCMCVYTHTSQRVM